MFGQAPDTPTPPNVSPLLLNSGPSPERTLPTRVLLLSPYGDLRASSRDQLPLPGPSTPMGSAALTISQPVQSGLPLQTTHEWPPANTTHRHQAQSEDIRPDSGGRRLGLRGRLLRVFRVSFRAWLCIPIQPVPGRLEHTPSVSLEVFHSASFLWHVDLTILQKSRRSKGEDDNGGDTPSQKTSAGGGHTISTRTQNNINNQVHQIPPSPGSLDAFMGSSSQSDRHGLPVTTSDGAVKEKARTETIIGIPEQRPSADLGLYMPTAQPISLAPNSALPYSDTSAEPPLFTKALYTEVSGHYPTICSNPPRP